jgi:hypothetical protein
VVLQRMKEQGFPSDLEAFARERLHADRFPNDYHHFKVFRCQACGALPLELTIEYHTGSRKGDFKGVITGRCSACGAEEKVFSYTGPHREPWREERPSCACGNRQFLVGECERIEREEGILGFFDEGVVVGKCVQCGRNRVLVYTD